MVERIQTAWQSGLHSVGIFIDLRKAFDTVDHNILIAKLENFGIRGTVLQLVRMSIRNSLQ